jgi:hypothetical protein
LVGHWRLDGDATDTSGSGLDGEIHGSPNWVTGKVGGAMEIDGDDWVEIPGTSPADGFPAVDGEVTWAAWFKTSNAGVLNTLIAQGPAGAAHVQGNRSINVEASGVIMVRAHSVGALTNVNSTGTVNDGQWHHVAVTIAFETDGANDTMKVYIDGDLAAGYETTDIDINQHAGAASDFILTLGARGTTPFVGLIDDVRVYDHALSLVEVLAAMAAEPWPYAFGPDPADGSLLEATWANISWRAGELAVSHDVYLGESLEDVNAGAEGTFVGNQESTTLVVGFPGFPIPGGLVPGTTYYWRIDEVNDADPNSPWKGDVWSFTVPPLTAYDPGPTDGLKYVDPEVTLSWTPGFGAKLHSVYVGENSDEVANASGAVPEPETTYSPDTLELGKTYYWRVDEFDGAATHKGNVWSFLTKPFLPITDPNLACWWMLDEIEGFIGLDQSGHGNDGVFGGSPEWVYGVDGYGLHLQGDSSGDEVVHSLGAASDWAAGTVALWVKVDSLGQDQYSSAFSSHYPNTAGFQIDVDGETPGLFRVMPGGLIFGTVTTGWTHLAVSLDGTAATLYRDGASVATGTLNDSTFNQFAIGVNRNGTNWLACVIDDFRVYDKTLNEDDIKLVMRIDPALPWNPSPSNGSIPDITAATPLSWSPGDNASSHEVYFGTDRDAVEAADTSDTTGIYRGRQNGTSFTPAEGVEWGSGPFYWRVDENNADGTVTEGRVWTFTVADFILVDDFESYTDNEGEEIWQTWVDGFGIPTNGSQVGYLMPPYTEQDIVHSGGQSMPLLYNNTAGVRNSEAVMTLTAPRDWTKHGVGALSLWFRGYPPSVGSFTQGAGGTITMTGSGSDIWGTSDQFHFAYKTLTGAGTIVARVDSVENTNDWAKAGVMIRESLEPGSTHAFACVTPENGVATQGRTDTDGSSFNTNEAGITAPHWVKLERDVAGNFTVSHSANGSTWSMVADSVPNYIPMTSEVYIGLAVTSHDAAQACEAKFSNVTITGNAGAQWMNQDIGILGNNAEPLYVLLSNAAGTPAAVVHDDPAAATIDTWTEWVIDLQAFADQGVNLNDVDKIAIGLGATGDPAATGGSGTIFIDDIRLLRPDASQQ